MDHLANQTAFTQASVDTRQCSEPYGTGVFRWKLNAHRPLVAGIKTLDLVLYRLGILDNEAFHHNAHA
jgi:hypothetical protein